MAEQTFKAASNPTLANDLISKATAEQDTTPVKADLQPLSDTLVNLPAGYITSDGEVIKTAEVRELNGKDEEFLSKTTTLGKGLNTILSRAVVSIGTEPATEKLLDSLLAGDRDALLIGIYRATFGNTAEIGALCQGCSDVKTIEVEINSDIKTKVLVDPADRTFTVEGRKGDFLVTLPTGLVQRELTSNPDRTMAELQTVLLEHCVVEINGAPVVSKQQVLNLGLVDRRNILNEITSRNPGPQFDNITVTCPDCEGEVVVPINLGTLFRF
jgi:hypothetical protein